MKKYYDEYVDLIEECFPEGMIKPSENANNTLTIHVVPDLQPGHLLEIKLDEAEPGNVQVIFYAGNYNTKKIDQTTVWKGVLPWSIPDEDFDLNFLKLLLLNYTKIGI